MTELPALEFLRVGLESAAYPGRLRLPVSAAPKSLYLAGNLALLDGPMVGLLASREVDPGCLMKAAEAIEVLMAADMCLIGGWHSPLEAALLEGVQMAEALLGILLATGSEHAVLPNRVRTRVEAGAGFALTHCGPTVHRITRAAALRRNELVIALSDVLLVPLAPSGSATLGTAKRAVAGGTPVFTVDLRANQQLLAAGASRFTRAALASALAKSSPDRS